MEKLHDPSNPFTQRDSSGTAPVNARNAGRSVLNRRISALAAEIESAEQKAARLNASITSRRSTLNRLQTQLAALSGYGAAREDHALARN